MIMNHNGGRLIGHLRISCPLNALHPVSLNHFCAVSLITANKACHCGEQAEEAKAQEEARKVEAIKRECEHDLAQAMPAYNAAIKVNQANGPVMGHLTLCCMKLV